MNARLVLALLLPLLACEDARAVFPVAADPAAAAPGELLSVERIRHYPVLAGRALLWYADLPVELPIEHGATLYRVQYVTSGVAGERVRASGLVALPRASSLPGVVSYQHPTRTWRTDVPSTPSPTAVLAALAFAGRGYVVAAPDYVGLGTSPGPHPYLHAATEAAAVVDLLRAGRMVAEHEGLRWPGRVFLTGFSQGGHATLAAHRRLEAEPVEGLRVVASAPIAGTYDLSRIQFPHALEGGAASHAAYLGYLVVAYAAVAGEAPSSVLAAPFADSLPRLLDGSRALPDVAAALPADPRALFRPEFLRAHEAEETTWLGRALRANDVHDWAPRAPVRLYYGESDRDASPEDARSTAARMRDRGGAATAVSVGDADHGASVLLALPRARAWFDSLAGEGTGGGVPR